MRRARLEVTTRFDSERSFVLGMPDVEADDDPGDVGAWPPVIGYSFARPWPEPEILPCAGCGASSWEWQALRGRTGEGDGLVVCAYCRRPRPRQ